MDFTLPESECWESTPSQNQFIRCYFKKRKHTKPDVIKRLEKQSITYDNSLLHMNKHPVILKTDYQNGKESTVRKFFNMKEVSNNYDMNIVSNKLALHKKIKRKQKKKLPKLSSKNTDTAVDSIDHLPKLQIFSKSGKLIQLADNISEESNVNQNKVYPSVGAPAFLDYTFSTNKDNKTYKSNNKVVNEENNTRNMNLMNNNAEIDCSALNELIAVDKWKKEKCLLDSSSMKNANKNFVNQFKSHYCQKLDKTVSKKSTKHLQKLTEYSSKIKNSLRHEPEVDMKKIIKKLDKNTVRRKQTNFQNNLNSPKQKIYALAKNECNEEATVVSQNTGTIEREYIFKNNINSSNKQTVNFQTKAQEKLRAAKFRYLNEKLYTETGNEAFEYFQTNVEEYKDYHIGYSSQVSKWPVNPVDLIIKDFQALNKSHIVADMGCGDAKIAQNFPNWTVHSFDLVALNEHVTACDISQVPLAKESVDIVVFCLSLMGLNLKDFLFEAHRILKLGGLLKIAEVESRIENLNNFIKKLQSFGFSLKRENISHKMFVFLDLIKVKKKLKKGEVPNVSLKPCLYKKR